MNRTEFKESKNVEFLKEQREYLCINKNAELPKQQKELENTLLLTGKELENNQLLARKE